MNIESIRIYAESIEQGFDFKNYFRKIESLKNVPIYNIYSSKLRSEITKEDSLIARIYKTKDIDVVITALCKGQEYPLLLIEYSTAVPTDDHKMQRSDVYFWGGIYQIPMMKISPTDKGMDKKFGGGDSFTNLFELSVALNKGAIFIPIEWEREREQKTLQIKDGFLSCIADNQVIQDLLEKLVLTIQKISNYEEYFNILMKEHKKTFLPIEDIKGHAKKIIKDSSRFKWKGNNLCCKINRFGHAMDPDRGILFFANMVLGQDDVTTEIQINRDADVNARGGYAALFDGIAREKEMLEYVRNIISTKDNKFSVQDAFHVFFRSLYLENFFNPEKIEENQYRINNEELCNYFLKSKAMAAKSIFFLSSKLVLSDKGRNVICSLQWDSEVATEYLKTLRTANFRPLDIVELTMKKAKEDIVTFTSVNIYKKMGCELLAVSYPGAQGDRCILVGNGRRVLRVYVDIIAYQKLPNVVRAYLQENKELLSNVSKDIEKLNKIKSDPLYRSALDTTFYKLAGVSQINEIYTSVGGKKTLKLKPIDVDYILMIEIENDENNTYIIWQIAILNLNIQNSFDSLKDAEGKIKGKLKLDKIYVIK